MSISRLQESLAIFNIVQVTYFYQDRSGNFAIPQNPRQSSFAPAIVVAPDSKRAMGFYTGILKALDDIFAEFRTDSGRLYVVPIPEPEHSPILFTPSINAMAEFKTGTTQPVVRVIYGYPP